MSIETTEKLASPKPAAGRQKAYGIGNYQLVNKLGSGVTGSVYQARHLESGKVVALKSFSNEFNESREFTKALLAYCPQLANMQHENIISTHEAFEDQGRCHLATEFMDHRSLNDVIQNEGPLEQSKALRYLLKLARGLAYMHSNGIIHRDVKPQSIFISATGVIKLADFGIAQAIDVAGLTIPGHLKLESAYMAPERAKGQRVDTRSDLYSLGVCFYYMLTGRTPFGKESNLVIVGKLAYQPQTIRYFFDSPVEKPVKELFWKLVKIKPSERYQNCNELISELEKVLDDINRPLIIPKRFEPSDTLEPTVHIDIQDLPKLPKRKKRHSGIVMSAVFSSALVVTAIASVYLHGEGKLPQDLRIPGIEHIQPYINKARLWMAQLNQDVFALRNSAQQMAKRGEAALKQATALNSEAFTPALYLNAKTNFDYGHTQMRKAEKFLEKGEQQQAQEAFTRAHTLFNSAETAFLQSKSLVMSNQELVQIKEQMLQARQQASTYKAQKHAGKLYDTALIKENHALQLMKNAQKHLSENKGKDADDAKNTAIAALQDATRQFKSAAETALNNSIFDQISHQLSTLRQIKQQLMRSQRDAQRSKAEQYASTQFDQAANDHDKFEKLIAQSKITMDKKHYRDAFQSLKTAIDTGKTSIETYKQAKQTAVESRIKQLQDLQAIVVQSQQQVMQLKPSQVDKKILRLAKQSLQQGSDHLKDGIELINKKLFLRADEKFDLAGNDLDKANEHYSHITHQAIKKSMSLAKTR